jgi:nucleoside-diphosphate-sugar epimerase
VVIPREVSTRVVVTGANGFIGSHLVEHLIASGDEVRAMVRAGANLDNLRDALARADARPELAHASLADVDAMAAAFDGADIIYHVAGLTAAFTRAEFERANATGVANVLAAIRAARRRPRRLVYVSSLMAAGPSHPEVARREHHAPRVGFTLYGDSKLAGEKLVYAAARAGEVEAVIVRPPAVYGPRDGDVLQMIRSAKFGLIAQPGLRPAWMSFVHALDLVDGIARAGRRGRPIPQDGEHALAGGGCPEDHVPEDPSHPAGAGIYFITDGERHTVVSFGKAAAAALGRRALALPFPRAAVLTVAGVNHALGRLRGKAPALTLDKARGSLAPGWWCDDSKAARELEYTPRWPLARGLEQTIAWARAARRL